MSTHTATSESKSKKSMKQDVYEHPDFYAIDSLLTEEHKLVRSSVRDFVKREISPYVEDWAQRAHFPYEIVKKFGEVGAFGPTLRSEEHTSELQSQSNLVCRLLLEKKKK